MDPLKVFYLDHLQSICARAETPTSLVEGKSLDEHAHVVRHILSKKESLMESNKLVSLLFDEDINTTVTPIAPAVLHTGQITIAHACQLNYQVLSFLGNDSNVHEIMMLPKLDTFVFLQMKGLAWRRMNIGARISMEMMACARGTRTELQVMISGC